MNRKFRLYWYSSSGTKIYNADRPTTLPSLAYVYDEADVLDLLLGRERFIEEVSESPPPLGIHVSDKVIAKEKLGGGDG